MKPEKILIVENESIIAKDLEMTLRRLGWKEIRVAYSGGEGVEAARAIVPDIILMDIRMGDDIDGITAVREISTFSDAPVLYLTAYADDETLSRAKTTRPYGYVVKPVEERNLHAAIEMAIYKYRTGKQLKTMETRLRQSQKMEALGTLAGGIAHDFNNILSVIMGYADLAKRKLDPGHSAHNAVSQVITASRRAKDLVKQILAFSRSTREQKKPVKVDLIVGEVLTLLRPSLPENLDVRQTISASDSMVLADPTQLHQIVMNLCTNAVHAMKSDGGILDIKLDVLDVEPGPDNLYQDIKPGNYLWLSVGDTGHGMEKGVLARIFEPYFTTKKPGEGTGMGLAMVHSIVENYGGRVSVISTPGEGSTFNVLLPRLNGEGGSEAPVEIPLRYGSERILFVDDEPIMVNLAMEMLSPLGYTVDGRVYSLDALDNFRREPGRYDAVITDMSMPRMDGIQLARELLRIRPDIPIALCTGFSESQAAEEAKKVGVRKVIMKPLVLETLSTALGQLLDN
jgi:two-component system cell cycle sensor histidine kinase/response regulator CckA